ncbi:DUF6174 domain-containing protein [Gracilimonas sp.]|uniref:DUF6174 domain-containing protein n=1 Tax=Gracilimonas sp. TaxID=1974203 RepID=UPI003BABA123
MRSVFFSVLLLFVTSCDNENGIITSVIEEDFSAIENPRERWEAYQLSDYQITQKRSCECLGMTYRANIFDGSVEKVTYEGNQSEEKDEWASRNAITVERAFDLLKQYEDKAHSITVDYHPKYGYPTKFIIDIHEMIADEEIIYRMNDLKRIE